MEHQKPLLQTDGEKNPCIVGPKNLFCEFLSIFPLWGFYTMELLFSASLLFIGIFINGSNTLLRARQILCCVFSCKIRAKSRGLKVATWLGYKKASGWEKMPLSKREEDANVFFCHLSSYAKHNIKGGAGVYFSALGSRRQMAHIKESFFFVHVSFVKGQSLTPINLRSNILPLLSKLELNVKTLVSDTGRNAELCCSVFVLVGAATR